MTSASGHAEQGERGPKLPEGGFRERLAWRAAYFIAVVCKPTKAGGQFDVPSLAHAEIVVTISRRADGTACRLRYHGFQIRMPGMRLQTLYIAFIRASNRPKVSFRPGLHGQPIHGVIAVIHIIPLHGILTFGRKSPARVLHRDDISLPRELPRRGALRPPVTEFILGGADQHYGQSPIHPFGKIEVGG